MWDHMECRIASLNAGGRMNLSPETQMLLDKVLAAGEFASNEEALAEALLLLAQKQELLNGEDLPKDELRRKLELHCEGTPATAAKSVDIERGSFYESRGE